MTDCPECVDRASQLATIDPQDLGEVERLRALIGVEMYTDHLSNALAAFARGEDVREQTCARCSRPSAAYTNMSPTLCTPEAYSSCWGRPARRRAKDAAQRLRDQVAAHAAEPPCGERDCLLHMSDGYIFTARDYWRGMYAVRDDQHAAVRELFDHGPYRDHCGGYEVHAWPCAPAAAILSELREATGHDEWLRIDYFAQEAPSD